MGPSAVSATLRTSWSSTQYDATYAQDLGLLAYDSYVYLFNGTKHYGFSVRCLKDEGPISLLMHHQTPHHPMAQLGNHPP